MTPGTTRQNRMKSDAGDAAVVASEEAQVKLLRKHPEFLLAPTGELGHTIRKAEGLRNINEICAEMDRILAGRKSVCGTVDGAPAELHGPSSAKGKGGYYFKSLEVAARLKLNESYDTWVPGGGFSIVPIGLEAVKEKLDIFKQNGVVAIGSSIVAAKRLSS